VRAAKKRAVRIKHEAALDYNATAAEHSGPAGDLRELIDAKIDRLPKRYRLPVVLCYIEGLTTEDAARLLGIPRRTVLSRLATARGKLAARLTRRGVTLLVTGLVSVGMGSSDGATYVLIDGTLRATTAYAASGLGNTASVLLATEVLRMTAWKKTAGLVLAFVLTAGIGTGLGVVASELQVGTAPITHADQPKPVEPQKRVPASTTNLETDGSIYSSNLKKAGVILPKKGSTQATNDPLEQIMRQIEDLKFEVQRLRQARETTPKPTQRGRD
jgi:hypothetical protein